MKLGQIGQAYNSGLGNIAWGFSEQMNARTLIVDKKPLTMFPERFAEHRITKDITDEDLDWLFEGIDALLVVETPYRWDVFEKAKKRGIKTCFMPMLEWMQRSRDELKYVDVYICPSTSTYNAVQGNKILVPTEVPVDTTKFCPKIVRHAKRFLHNSGHGGAMNRNSTPELIEAMKYVKADIELVLNSQFPQEVADSRIRYQEGNIKNYWDLYRGEDVYILPGKYGVAYLGIQESAACGMPIMFTDMAPFNEFLPRPLLIPPREMMTINLIGSQREPMALHDPRIIAKKIDEVANMDLTPYSERSLYLAKVWSWEEWKPKYEAIFYEKA